MSDDRPRELGEGTPPAQAEPDKPVNAVRPAIPVEVLDKLPPEVRQLVIAMSSSVSGPRPHPLAEKIQPEHVMEMLQGADREAAREHTRVTRGQWFTLVYVILGLVTFGLTTWYLVPIDKDLYKEMVKLVFAFAAGAAGGYGYKAYKDAKDE